MAENWGSVVVLWLLILVRFCAAVLHNDGPNQTDHSSELSLQRETGKPQPINSKTLTEGDESKKKLDIMILGKDIIRNLTETLKSKAGRNDVIFPRLYVNANFGMLTINPYCTKHSFSGNFQLVYKKVTEDASDPTHLGQQQTIRCLRDVMHLLAREMEKGGLHEPVGFGNTIQFLERSTKSTRTRRSEEEWAGPGYKWHLRRLKRRATFGIGTIHNGIFTIQPYCSYNAENKLQGSLIDVLIQLIDDVDQSFIDRSIDVIECMVYLAGNVTDALESNTLVITSGEAATVLDSSNLVNETTQGVTTTQATTKPMETTLGPSTVVPATSTFGKVSSTPQVISSSVNQPSTSVTPELLSETTTADLTTGTAVEMTKTTTDLSTTAVSELTSTKTDSTTPSEKSGAWAASPQSISETATADQTTETALEMDKTTADLPTTTVRKVTSAKMDTTTTPEEPGTTEKGGLTSTSEGMDIYYQFELYLEFILGFFSSRVLLK
ncbi:uncharacterized protein LOC135208745 [Macrobrachium nipponense]|uniref:uncharacterized protein LOC135208745 n=1 Tax=Macrobrachium nipponense TaxID=159736 RepID=UPI0030C86863